jgi:pilus assembly protein CpaE
MADLTENVSSAAMAGAYAHRPTVSLTGGTDGERSALRYALTSMTDPRVDVIEPLSPTQSLGLDGASRQILIAILSNEPPEKWAEELHPWIEHGSWAAVIAVIGEHSPEAVRWALHAGADEVIFTPIEPIDLTSRLLKIIEKRGGARNTVGSGTYSLVSVAGGVGVSSLTIALGTALLTLTEKKVALVDLGFQCSALATMLDLEPEHTISELADPTSAIDSIRLESVRCRHSSGLYLLAAPKRIEEGETISPATIDAVLNVMRQLFDYVLVDCGHQLTEGSVAAWERTGKILYVLDQSITSVRSARRFLDLFSRLHLKQVEVQLVLNRFVPANPITIEKIEGALARPIAFRIPRDDETLSAAEVEANGMTALRSDSEFAAAVDNLARTLIDPAYQMQAPNGARKSGGLVARILAGVARHPARG